MAYTSMKRIISNENDQYNAGSIMSDEYSLWKENTQNKLDVFFACNRITQTQYEELCGLLIDTSGTTTSA